MFDDRTPDNIRTEILADMGTLVQTREGSFAAEMAGPVAVELSMVYQALAAMLPVFYVDEGSGGFIDLAAARYGIYRKQGTKAKAEIHLTGRANLTIPAGTVFLSDDGVEFSLDAAVKLGLSGLGEGFLTAQDVGDAYNVSAGALTQMVMTMTGLESWQSEAASGGTDPETDEALVGRLYDHWQKPSTSSNVHDYERWALEVDGVGAAKVLPLWNGPGTVKVLIVGPDRNPVGESVVQAAIGHIEDQRAVGATVTVVSAGSVSINVSATLTLDGSATMSEVREKFESELNEYLQSIAFESYTVLYNRISYLLLSVIGVTDYVGLTVNGGTGNIQIPADDVPVAGAVTLI